MHEYRKAVSQLIRQITDVSFPMLQLNMPSSFSAMERTTGRHTCQLLVAMKPFISARCFGTGRSAPRKASGHRTERHQRLCTAHLWPKWPRSGDNRREHNGFRGRQRGFDPEADRRPRPPVCIIRSYTMIPYIFECLLIFC